ncbi:WD repeat-containing protein ATCSA-1 isoform X3 [Zingiber officinale]|nr:WD repeat-containing protein ATCSA-1 isoform X3 [Zingiber officinale]XP_042405939.1 WD repeat-containing protein ATCSA-1 isoform X3 [Zingiber officinale]
MAQVVMDFKMPGKVYGTAMSSVAKAHMLIAAGSADVQVRLCDIASGAFTHTLSGHRGGIMNVEWSTSSEWILMTGGCDGAIRFWDIRRAGCFRILDQSQSQFGRRPPFPERTPTEVVTRTAAAGSSSVNKLISKKKATLGNGKKQSQAVCKLQNLTTSHTMHKSHPGTASSYSRATAHFGAVTGLRATRDGLYLLSSGSDSRLRLWDIESGCSISVNFEATRLQTNKAIQLALSQDSSAVFIPSMSNVKVYDVLSGLNLQTFYGHYDMVNCCYFNMQDQELYTGSNDRHILVWSPPSSSFSDMDEEERKRLNLKADEDNWSQ